MLSTKGEPPCAYVVGIGEDIKNTPLLGDPSLFYYRSAAQSDPRRLSLVVRTRGDASNHAEVIRQALQTEMPGASYVTVTPFVEAFGD